MFVRLNYSIRQIFHQKIDATINFHVKWTMVFACSPVHEMKGDVMYFHQTLKQLDISKFIQAVVKEVNGHVDNKHCECIKCSSVPINVEIMLSVWTIHNKHNLTTNTKYRAQLNIHGGIN